jgi:uncharacterized RDD family membrane protein YckC
VTDNATPREPKYVGFWKRVLASIIDTLILLAVILPVGFAIYGLDYLRRSQAGETVAFDLLIQIVVPALAVILFWRFRGATPGKMLISAKIVDARTYGPPSARQLVGRYFAYFVSMVFMLGFIWVAFDKRKQGWHDKLAGTVVVEEEDDD